MSPVWPLTLALLTACSINGLTTRTVASEQDVETMPELSGLDHRGQSFSLQKALQKGPVVVIFYRGHW